MEMNPSPLDDLAEDLTRVLNIPFQATGRGRIAFREPLRVTDWSVPMIFDGHAARDGDALVPTDFVGHVLFSPPCGRPPRAATAGRGGLAP